MKINYVVAVYVDPHARNNFFFKVDKLYAVKCHLKMMETLKIPYITKFTLVINESSAAPREEIERCVNENYSGSIPIEIKYRFNWGRSYAAWESQIRDTLHEEFDYYFLTEDDYCPVSDDFYVPFLNKFDDTTALTCALYISDHPAISYGLISKSACQSVFNKHGEIFFEYNKMEKNKSHDLYHLYEHGVDWQVIYHRHFISEGYNFKDVSRVSTVYFKYFHSILDYSSMIHKTPDQMLPILVLPVY